MKHAADPDKFVDSELDLDEEIHKLHSLAAVPHLYPELARAPPPPRPREGARGRIWGPRARGQQGRV